MSTLAELNPRVSISSLPFTITQPGVYSVTQNLQLPQGSSGNGITVLASNVTIDLNGFTLRGGGLSSQHGIYLEAFDNLTIRDGQLRAWGGDGISAAGRKGLNAVNVKVALCHGTGLSMSEGCVSGCTFEDCDDAGIVLSGDLVPGVDVTLQPSSSSRCVVRSNRGGGIRMNTQTSARLQDVEISGNTGSGIDVSSVAGSPPSSAELSVSGGSCSSNSLDGMRVRLDQLEQRLHIGLLGCAFSSNGGSGIDCASTSPSSSFSIRCASGACSDNGRYGISAGDCPDTSLDISSWSCDRNLLGGVTAVIGTSGGGAGAPPSSGKVSMSSFTCMKNSGPGISFSSFAPCDVHLSGGQVCDNTGAGFDMVARGPRQTVSLDGTYSRNSLDGVRLSSGADGTSCDIQMSDCRLSDNGGNGFSRVLHHSSTISDFGMSRCRASGNGGSGVDDDCDGISVRRSGSIVACDFDRNASSGLRVTGTGKGRTTTYSLSSSSFSDNAVCGNDVDEDCDGLTTEWKCEDDSLSRNGAAGARHNYHYAHVDTSLSFSRCRMLSNGAQGLVVGTEECDDGNFAVRSSDCVFSSNQLDGLALDCTSSGATSFDVDVARCAMSDNSIGSGFSFVHRGGAAGTGSGGGGGSFRLSSNVCSSNGAHGVDVDCALATTFAVLFDGRDDDCDGNADDGLHFAGTGSSSGGGGGGSVHLEACRFTSNGSHGADEDCDDLDCDRCVFDNNVLDGHHVTCSTTHLLSCSSSGNLGNGGSFSCTSSFSAEDCAFGENSLDGVEAAAPLVCSRRVHAIHNGNRGMQYLSSSGVIHRDLAARNGLLGASYACSNMDISECRYTSNRGASAIGRSGMVLDGTGNTVHDCTATDCSNGFELVSGSNRLYDNSAMTCANPLFQQPGASADLGPAATAATASSPTTNVGF